MRGLRLDKPRIRSGVSQPVPHLPGVWRVQTRLDAAYQPGVELQVLHALATHPKKMIVDRLDLRRRSRRGLLPHPDPVGLLHGRGSGAGAIGHRIVNASESKHDAALRRIPGARP